MNTLNVISDFKIDQLNKMAFGVDINKLESYLIAYKRAAIVSDTTRYGFRYNILKNIMKGINKSSVALNPELDLQALETDDCDRIFMKYRNVRPIKCYGVKSESLSLMESILDKNEDGTNITAIVNIPGIDVSCTYINGRLYRIYVIGENQKYLNITKIIKNKPIEYIDSLKNYGLVEFRGKLTILDKYADFRKFMLNTECTVMHSLRVGTDLEKLNIIFNDVYFDEKAEVPFDTQYSKLEYIEDLGLQTVYFGYVRNVDRSSLHRVIAELDDYFFNARKNREFDYQIDSIQIRIDNDIICGYSGSRINYVSSYCNPIMTFESTVVDFENKIEQGILNFSLVIEETKCNDKVTINKIKIDDMMDIEYLGIAIGSKVEFFVIENEAVLVK